MRESPLLDPLLEEKQDTKQGSAVSGYFMLCLSVYFERNTNSMWVRGVETQYLNHRPQERSEDRCTGTRMDAVLTLFLLCPLFFSTVTSQDNVCVRPELSVNIEMDGIQRFYNPGAELVLSCKSGYTPLFGPRKIVCSASGQWTKTKLKCILKRCPYPDEPYNGEIYYEDNVYQSIVNYTCHEGYVLSGPISSVCQANGTWSNSGPECKPVTCGLAPIPEFGVIIYDKSIRGNTTDYGFTGTYKCRPPYVLIGDSRAECTASGKWTKTPECRVVSCPPPENIQNGYLSNTDDRDFDYMEKVKYGCTGDYVLEGNLEIACQQNGEWSEKPSCKAPCSVGINKGRILYKGKKLWISDLKPNKVFHKDIVSLYCMNKERKCGYAVPTQCIDGNLIIPECFEEPTFNEYNFHSSHLPSEIQQC